LPVVKQSILKDSAPIATWNMVEPLMESDSDHQQSALSGSDFDDTGTHRQGMVKLRQERNESPWYLKLVADSLDLKKSALWIGLLVALVVGATFFVLSLVKEGNSPTIQKNP
jgi:hypothetical protein